MNNKNPWLGLASYEEPKGNDNDPLFCGRDEETLDMVRLIDNNLFVTLYGSSGIGKSSLLKAGVIPILRRKDYFPLYVRLSQEPDNLSYAEAIVRKLQSSGLTEEHQVAQKHTDGNDRLYLWHYFATTRFFNEGHEVYPVVILDQFEEVFRDADKKKAELLLQQIYLLLNDELEIPDREGYSADTNYRFVASIREDFLFVLEDSIDELSLDLYKNNRYRLRPMKPEQAKQVIRIGVDEGCIKEEQAALLENLIIDLLDKSSPSNEIDPLLLSLICSKTYSIKKGKYIEPNDLAYWGKGHDLLGKYYGEATSSLNSYQKKFLQSLVADDGSGARKRKDIKQAESQLGSKAFRKLTEGDNKLLAVNKASGTVELVHDMLCPIIQQSKEELIQKKNDTILSLLLGIIACFGIYSLHTFFIHHIVDDGINKLSIFYYALCSFFILAPVICTELINKLKASKITTLILTALIAIPTFNYYNKKDIDSFAVNTAYIMCAACLAFILFVFRKQEHKEVSQPIRTIRDSFPLQLYYFFMLSYLFLESVFGSYWNTVSINNCIPTSSIWGVFLLPFLSVYITNRLFNREMKLKSILEWCLFIIPFALALNATYDRPIHLFILIFLLAAYIICLWLHFKGRPYRQRVIATTINSLVIVLVFACNLGFNVFKIKYSSVKYIYPYSWGTIFVQNENNMFGTVDAFTGDTVVPAVLQTNPNRNKNYMFYHVCKKNETRYNEPLCVSKVEHDTMYLQTAFLQTSLFYRTIGHSNMTDEDKSFNTLTLKVFEELRNAILLNSTVGRPIKTSEMPKLRELTERQNKRYNSCYYNIVNNNKGSENDKFTLAEKDMSKFIINLTRNLYVLQLNEILSDSLNTIKCESKRNILALYRPIFMVDYLNTFTPDHTINIDVSLGFNTSTGDYTVYFQDTLSLQTTFQKLNSNDIIDWFRLYQTIICIDMDSHVKDFTPKVVYTDALKQLTDSLKANIKSTGTDLNQSKNILNQTAGVLTNMKDDMGNSPIDTLFKNTIMNAFDLLTKYSESDATGPFTEKAIELCEYLYISGRFRDYSGLEDYKNRLDRVIKEKEKHYHYRLNSPAKSNPQKKGEKTLIREKSLYHTVNASDSLQKSKINEVIVAAGEGISLSNQIMQLQNDISNQIMQLQKELSKAQNEQLNTKPTNK